MPSLEIKTNVKLDDPKKFVEEFSTFAAELLSKPLKYIAVSFTHNEYMAWNGTFDPCFLLTIVSLDNITADTNEQYSKALFQFAEEKLKVPDNRGYITFIDPGRANLGHQKTTFHTIFGKK
ncbi:uncharacterized protein PHACADRAFT_261823 [Phanerochaete carnosa HHB-10118-sp]|uniref:L-dopachrome isomerase n=1 Tax=Phanerochaete carnosa (strain HHB-10118-sp) TaxID=650164 RepID=K5VYA7_PHACS|nr:uncharacterized protein PHACADRAFT_261823 [Phanerochaete carnosa HHB-10118-sp]EKM51589.1 hypothetical protein PHACADRAFT_261823 [Phanerochaete carnosa HHB-10118-sp]